VVPFALAFVFSLTLADVAGGGVRFTFAFVNEDHGRQAAILREEVLAPLDREKVIRLRDAPTREEGRRLAGRGDVDAAIVVPKGFSQAAESGAAASLQVIGNADATLATEVARAIAQGFAGRLSSVRLAVATAIAAGGGRAGTDEVRALGERAAHAPDPLALEDVTARSRELDPSTFYSAGMAVFFLFFTVQFGVSSLLDERREGTLRRLLAAPVRRGAVLGGKLATGIVLGLASMAVLVVATSLLIGADWGSPLGVALLVACGVAAATGVTALIATFARTPDQAGYLQAIVALVLGMLGGSFFSLAQVGGVVEALSMATPHAWFLRGLGDLAGGGGVSDALVPAGAILAFAAVCGGIALLRVRRLLAP
jgi:ABC-2 type transport system permease protein